MPTKVIQQNNATQTVVTTAETVVVTTPAYTYDYPNTFVGGEHSGIGLGVSINGIVNVNPSGAGTTGVTVRVRQGTISGTVVSTEVQTIGAAVSQEITYSAEDTTRWCAQAGGGVYVVTLQFAGATGNASVTMTTAEIEGA